MIPFASQRGSGQDLATHLLNAYDNDMVEVMQVRGAIAQDLHGAFKEWQVHAETLTRCRKYLYSLSINPDPAQGPLTRDQYLDYVSRAEEVLGLTDQPRAIVFHVKHGREHCHVVWSRIDADHQRAVHLAFDRDKLMRVTRGFAHVHGLELPAGYHQSRLVGQVPLYEKELERQTGLSQEDHKRQITEAWAQSDDARSFVQALAERGYILATGKRPYVLVDLYGGMHALSRMIDDKSVRTKDVRAFLEDEYPLESLPSVEEAQELAAAHRKLIDGAEKEDRKPDQRATLKHSQQERRATLDAERVALSERQRELRAAQQSLHRTQRDQLRADHLVTVRAIRRERTENHPTGLAAFLGKISGVNLLRETLHRYQDAKRLEAYRERREQLSLAQRREDAALALRLKVQSAEWERKAHAMALVEKREIAALARDERREARIRARERDGTPPFREQDDGRSDRGDDSRVPDLLSAYDQVRQHQEVEIPDLLAAFGRAASARKRGAADGGSGKGLEQARPPEPGWGRRGHDRDPKRGS